MLKPLLGTRGIKSRCTTFMVLAAGLVLSLVASGTALAHTDPAGSTATGVSISITAFRNDQSTPVLPGTVTQCETIYYRATLAWAEGDNGAFEGGTWTINLPDGTPVDVTPAGGVPCIGGTTNDALAPGGRGQNCEGSPESIDSDLVPYTVSPGDVVGGFVSASTGLAGAFAHVGTNDTPGTSASTGIGLEVEFCDDGLFCNGVETCDPQATDGTVLGQCVPGTPVQCADGFCFNEVCDEDADACVRTSDNQGEVCNDPDLGNQCIPDVCVDGVCVEDSGTATTCEDPGFCANAACNPDTGACEETADNEGEVCNDPDTGDLCVPDLCVEGECVADSGTATTCEDPGFCANSACNPDTGLCEDTPDNEGEICQDDQGSLCQDDLCVEGVCTEDAGAVEICDDDTCQACDPSTGECVDRDPLPDVCDGVAICRTPGFWMTHAGTATPAPNAQNITQAVIDEVNPPGLDVCGTFLTNTDLNSSTSALEALCTKGKPDQQKMVFHLTSTALNCVVGECPPDILALLDSCNDVCAAGATGPDVQSCNDQLDCFNNGGEWDGNSCLTGVCETISDSGEILANLNGEIGAFCDIDGGGCDAGQICVPFEDNCHDRELCPDLYDDGEINGSDLCFEPPGPAGSGQLCSVARRSATIVP